MYSGSVDEMQAVLKCHGNAIRREARGEIVYKGGGGGAYYRMYTDGDAFNRCTRMGMPLTGCIFWFTGRWACNRRGF